LHLLPPYRRSWWAEPMRTPTLEYSGSTKPPPTHIKAPLTNVPRSQLILLMKNVSIVASRTAVRYNAYACGVKCRPLSNDKKWQKLKIDRVPVPRPHGIFHREIRSGLACY